MKEFVNYVVQNLVDKPDDVKVVVEEIEPSTTMIKITVDQTDLGKVIGKKGGTINALRTLALILGARDNKRVRVEVS